jgi:hypothetical protein
MNRLIAFVVPGIVAFAPAAWAQSADKAMAVYVTAAEVTDVAKLDKATEKRLKDAIDAAEKARKDLEKELKAKHGNKKESWPAEVQEQYYIAEETEALAQADWDYRRVKQEGLSDSAEDIRKSVIGDGMAGRKENINLVQSPADAELIVEVVGRRSAKTLPTQLRADRYYVSFTIKPGPKLAPAAFGAASSDYRFRRFGIWVWRLQAPRAESMWWRFDAHGDQRWGNAANNASLVIEDFIAKNYDAMKRAASY